LKDSELTGRCSRAASATASAMARSKTRITVWAAGCPAATALGRIHPIRCGGRM